MAHALQQVSVQTKAALPVETVRQGKLLKVNLDEFIEILDFWAWKIELEARS